MTSGYSPIGAMIASDRIMEPFLQGDTTFAHGYTFGGHPVSAAVALANLDIFEREGLNQHVLDNHRRVPARPSRSCTDLPIVGDVRGDGYFYGIELVKDKATRETFDDDESERLLRGFLSKALFDAGLYCRADDRGDPVIQLVAAADLRPVAVRRDRADPARRCSPRPGAGSDRARADRSPTATHQVRRLPEKAGRDRAVLRRGPRRRPRRARRGRRRRRPALRRAGGVRPRRRPRAVPRLDRRAGCSGLADGAPTCLTVTLLDGLVVGALGVRVVDALPVARWCSGPRARARAATTKLARAASCHRAPAARALGRRRAAATARSSRPRWSSRCRSTSGRSR